MLAPKCFSFRERLEVIAEFPAENHVIDILAQLPRLGAGFVAKIRCKGVAIVSDGNDIALNQLFAKIPVLFIQQKCRDHFNLRLGEPAFGVFLDVLKGLTQLLNDNLMPLRIVLSAAKFRPKRIEILAILANTGLGLGNGRQPFISGGFKEMIDKIKTYPGSEEGGTSRTATAGTGEVCGSIVADRRSR